MVQKNCETKATVEERFRELEARWNRDTAHLSSSTRIINHPAFAEIVALGPSVVPFMLRDLETKPRLWVWALPKILGTSPENVKDSANIGELSKAWLQWAKEHGYEW